MTNRKFGPVRPDNTPATRRRRPDPDADTVPAARKPTTTAEPAPAPDPPPAAVPDPEPEPAPEPAPAPDPEPTSTRPPSSRARRTAAHRKTPTKLGAGITLDDLLSGRKDPADTRVQSGARLPAYLHDALLTVKKLNGRPVQDLLAEAVDRYLPDEILDESWVKHGGEEGERPRW